MSYCHENQSFITYRLFFQTKSDKIYSRVVTIPHIHSDILLDTQKSCFIRFRAAFLVFSVNFVHKNTSRNITNTFHINFPLVMNNNVLMNLFIYSIIQLTTTKI